MKPNDIPDHLHTIRVNAEKIINDVKDASSLEDARVRFLGRKSEMTEIFRSLKDFSIEEKRKFGQEAQNVRKFIEDLLAKKEGSVGGADASAAIDISEPGKPVSVKEGGTLHPNTLTQYELEDVFERMGFMVLDGPQLESEFYNFTALNVPESHPARDMQDTFWMDEPGKLLRTHTTSILVRALQKYGAPSRGIMPGKCFRNEATDVRHEHTFYQLDGYLVDKGINMSHMKGVLEVLGKQLYGEKTKLRLRPKFYPFVEPGVNGEVTCFTCEGKGCRLCKQTGWLEIFGAGMIHPKVLEYGGIDSKKYSGFAFGSGLNRLTMLKYGIDDIRTLESGDLRFLKQF
jgi:phenylalanyl-tRNA synthetase alpha chain